MYFFRKSKRVRTSCASLLSSESSTSHACPSRDSSSTAPPLSMMAATRALLLLELLLEVISYRERAALFNATACSFTSPPRCLKEQASWLRFRRSRCLHASSRASTGYLCDVGCVIKGCE